MKQLIFVLIAGTIALAGCNLIDSDSAPVPGDQSASLSKSPSGNVGLPGRATVLRLLGTAEAYDGFVPDIDGDGVDDPAVCFDVDLLDASGRKIGTATACLSKDRLPPAGTRPCSQ